ncbi:hypothetical protein FHS51_000133 [Sphingobium wenxiniae]|nr:hypothetical protein [Sphingobium wenxiniae]
MQTILGASGQIGHELAVSLRRDFTEDDLSAETRDK